MPERQQAEEVRVDDRRPLVGRVEGDLDGSPVGRHVDDGEQHDEGDADQRAAGVDRGRASPVRTRAARRTRCVGLACVVAEAQLGDLASFQLRSALGEPAELLAQRAVVVGFDRPLRRVSFGDLGVLGRRERPPADRSVGSSGPKVAGSAMTVQWRRAVGGATIS